MFWCSTLLTRCSAAMPAAFRNAAGPHGRSACALRTTNGGRARAALIPENSPCRWQRPGHGSGMRRWPAARCPAAGSGPPAGSCAPGIWAQPKGHAWSYQAVYDLVLRLRARTGIGFDPHWFRHSAATRWLRDGVRIEVVSELLGHSSVTMTQSVYGHLTAQDARVALEKAGWLTGNEVSW